MCTCHHDMYHVSLSVDDMLRRRVPHQRKSPLLCLDESACKQGGLTPRGVVVSREKEGTGFADMDYIVECFLIKRRTSSSIGHGGKGKW